MNKEIEQYVDELYEIHKESGERMIELTNANKEILDDLERGVDANLSDIKRWSKFFFWLQFTVSVIVVSFLLWSLHDFKKEFDWKILALYESIQKVAETQSEQNKMLDKFKKPVTDS